MKSFSYSTKIINFVFLLFFLGIIVCVIHHFGKTQALIDSAAQTIQHLKAAGPGADKTSSLGNSDIQIFEKHLFSLLPSFLATICLYIPIAILLFFISFLAAVVATYKPFLLIARIVRGAVHIIDSIPLILWVFIGLIIAFSVFSNAKWESPRIIFWITLLYYSSLSFSYGMVLIVVFFQQNQRVIFEIRSQNILNGEIVSGISSITIIWRLFRFHFAKTIMIRQIIYAFLYILLFDYCLMYIFDDFRQSGYFTPLTVKAGLFFKKLNCALPGSDIADIYSHLHATFFCLILLLAVLCFYFLFMFFDHKDMTSYDTC